ncbi:unnamed protein product [marine sediment metagenome]|uniref:Uncharacterized protein n=1 Tax=marine sediment metagenome TaxID=412755 RepID=X0X1R5_9ZZZZ
MPHNKGSNPYNPQHLAKLTEVVSLGDSRDQGRLQHKTLTKVSQVLCPRQGK